jgi:hypothetical protein
MAEKPQDNPLAATIGELVTAHARGDLDTVRERARSLAYATDMAAAAPEEPAEAEEAPPREPSFHERFAAALDAKAEAEEAQR